MHPTSKSYRSDIDGLRAVAVFLVVGYHAFPDSLPAGFIGVDIFFVISGYLISTILLNELVAGRFTFTNFYARRVRRIFPALLVVLGVCSLLSWLLLSRQEFQRFGQHVLAGSGFASNFLLLSESGYFDKLAITKPLLHLWSLGIEEQFYIFWPLALWWVGTKKRRIGWLIAGVILASFGLNLFLVREHQVATFYSPLTRIWELLVGAALAYGTLYSATKPPHTQGLTPPRSSFGANGRALVGCSLIGTALLFLDESKQFPGWWALLPTVGAALLISAKGAWVNRFILSQRPFVGLGLPITHKYLNLNPAA